MDRPKDTAISPELLDQIVRSLDDILSNRRPPEGPPTSLAWHEGLAALYGKLLQIRGIILAFANGRLSVKITGKGYIIGALKTLQAHLNHLTWQTKTIASGDYTQRVDFMGEFSEAFNSMVVRLDDTVKALQESEERYRQMAITDHLTGMFNRSHFYFLAEKEIQRSRRHRHALALVMLDIDHFKQVNDRFGHDRGDKVLQTVAGVLMRAMRSGDVSARYGGEEFIILLPETDPDGAWPLAERLREMIAQETIEVGSRHISITASFGVNILAPNGDDYSDVRHDLEKLIKGADSALYAAKNAGRNRVKAAWEMNGPEDQPPN